MIKMKAKLPVLEVDGVPIGIGDPEQEMTVLSHDNFNDIDGYVILHMPDGKEYTVSGQDLGSAVARCLDV